MKAQRSLRIWDTFIELRGRWAKRVLPQQGAQTVNEQHIQGFLQQMEVPSGYLQQNSRLDLFE